MCACGCYKGALSLLQGQRDITPCFYLLLCSHTPTRLIHHTQVLREGGEAKGALSLLQGQKDKIRDKLGAAMEEAGLQLDLGAAGEAEKIYRRVGAWGCVLCVWRVLRLWV